MTGVIKTYDNIQPREISPTSLGSCPNAPRTQVGEVDWMHWDVSEGTHQASPLTHEKEFCWLLIISIPWFGIITSLLNLLAAWSPRLVFTTKLLSDLTTVAYTVLKGPQNIKLHNDNGWWEKHPSIINFIQFDPWYVFTSGVAPLRDTSEHQTTNI